MVFFLHLLRRFSSHHVDVKTMPIRKKYILFYQIYFEITGYPINLIGSQGYELFTNRTIFCSKSHLFLNQ